MSWGEIYDWAEQMDMLERARRRERLKVAAEHFGLDLRDCEAPQFLRYETGDFFVAHQDGNTSLIRDDTRFRRISVVLFLSAPSAELNYLGGCGGALVFHGPRLTRQLDHSIDLLHRRLDAQTEEALGRRMHFPVGWDPFFRDTMTLEEVYRYGTQHYDFHRRQLTLPETS